MPYAAQRWSGSRLARQMRPHLGTGLWDEFVAYANRHCKARWLRPFTPASGVLRAAWAPSTARRARTAVLVALRAGAGMAEREVGAALERLHLDHERPLHASCHWWHATPWSWDDGLDGAALCHDLFGCARARRTAPRVCASGAVRRSTPRVCCCGL